ncbi:MAG TPA: pitrilysin family protein [Kofleriaceae bacterium]|nr:pitrilysin family protein [Kofleriaceae bacterium]
MFAAPDGLSLEAESRIGRALVARRWRLENGLGVIVVVDRTAPIVSYQTWYRVGSRHEEIGKTGLAHLFEHLMFAQTETLTPGEFDRVVERTGGESNAATWVDWTHYRLSLPAMDLPLAVRLESERMSRLLLTSETVEPERDVVTNERRERVEDDVDGWLDEQLMSTAFEVHPYRWPTIGWMADIRSVGLDDIRAFYRTWYAPNNATLVVVGDVDEQNLLGLVREAYAGIPAAILPTPSTIVEPPQDGERLKRAKRPIASDRVLCGWKVVGQAHPDWAALELLTTLLAGSPSSRLHRRLVIEKELASTVDVQLTPFRDPSLLRVAVTTARGHSAEESLAEIDRVIADLAERGADEAEVQKAKNLTETDFWSALVDADGKAEALGHHETALGDFRTLNDLADRLAAVTAADLKRVVREYLVPRTRTVIVAEPEGDGDGKGAGAGAGDDDDDGDEVDDEEADA